MHKVKNLYKKGNEIRDVKLNLSKMMKSKDKAVTVLTKGVEFLLKKNKVTYFKGVGSFKSKNEISVKDDKWVVSLTTHSDAADLENVFYFWPEKHKPKVRKWVAEHFEQSNLFDISMQTELENGLGPNLSWSFAFSDTSFAPLKGFPLIEQSSGHFVSKDYATSVILEEVLFLTM